MTTIASKSFSDLVREHANATYVRPARLRRERTITINVGQVQKGVGLRNRVSLVCQALKSEKFLRAHGLKLISETGPPSGQSTTVVYTYEFIDPVEKNSAPDDPWLRLRGIAKDIFACLGGGEAFLRQERTEFDAAMKERERGNDGRP
jgi:hypothetical protein